MAARRTMMRRRSCVNHGIGYLSDSTCIDGGVNAVKLRWNLAEMVMIQHGRSIILIPDSIDLKQTLENQNYSLQGNHERNFDYPLNLSSTGRNGPHLTDDIFKCVLMNAKSYILIRIALKFIPKCPIDDKSAMVQVMAWRLRDDKPMLIQFTDAFMWHYIVGMSLTEMTRVPSGGCQIW